MLPPRLLRRLLFPPLVLLFTVGAVVVSPLLFLIGLIATPSRRGRRRTLRLLLFGLSWLVMESMALVACLGLWIASGFGGRLRSEPSVDRHYALVRWFLSTLFNRAVAVFKLRVDVFEPEPTPEEQAARLTRPVIVLSRHAGPGDSFLLIHELLSRYQRRPRIVMKAALQLDPSIDVVINRLPHAFVRPHRSVPAPRPSDETVPASGPLGETVPASMPSGEAAPASVPSGEAAPASVPSGEAAPASRPSDESDGTVIHEIRRLASGLDPTGALVIFPEGGNFTPSRRRRGIRRLEEAHRYREAARARRLDNLLPPRSGGAFAAIDAAPTADVIFVAHTGLDDLVTVGDVWRALPMEQVIVARWWRVPAAEVPRDRDEVVQWLFDWWERIDAWIEENRPARVTS